MEDLYERLPDGALVLSVHVQPGASRSVVGGRRGAALRVRVAVPPQRGEATAAVLAVVAEAFGVRPRQVSLVAGATSRSKRIRLDGLSEAAFCQRLAGLAEG